MSTTGSTNGIHHVHSGESFGEALEIPRFIRRNRPFHQSANEVAILHNHGPKIWWLRRHDWFHALARLPTWKSGVLLLGIWTLMIILFAGIYMGFDRRNPELNCGLGIENEPIEFGAAFAFSLETCTTVGYGLPSGTNAFFESCQGIQTAIYFQMVWSMMFNAFLFAFFFTSLGRCDARGAQVLFSDKAVMSIIDGLDRGAHFSAAMPEFGAGDMGPLVMTDEDGNPVPVPADLLALADYLESLQR